MKSHQFDYNSGEFLDHLEVELNKQNSNKKYTSLSPIQSQEFLQRYEDLMWVDRNNTNQIKIESLIKQLQTAGIHYIPTENSDHFSLTLLRNTSNFEALTFNCILGPFSTLIKVYRSQQQNHIHNQCSLSGNSGNVYFYQVGDHLSLAVKCISYNQRKTHLITKAKIIIRVVRQYFIAKIASALKIGPHLIKFQQFDLIMHQNSIQFWMEQCQLIQDQQKKYQFKKSLTKSLKLMHALKIVHCDIKAQNIAYSHSFKRAVFIDFGISKILSHAPGYKFSTYFLGTLDYCSPQMQKLYVKKEKDYVDLYYNDAHCLHMIFTDGQSRSTDTPINEMIRYCYSQDDQFNFLKIIFFLYQDRINEANVLIKETKGKKNISKILELMNNLKPNEKLRQLYHNNFAQQWSQSIRFASLFQTYKRNTKYSHLFQPNVSQTIQNQNQLFFQQDKNWRSSILRQIVDKHISLDKLDEFQEKNIKNFQTQEQEKQTFKYFINQIDIQCHENQINVQGSQITKLENNRINFFQFQQYDQYAKKEHNSKDILAQYQNYLHIFLQEIFKTPLNFWKIRNVGTALRQRALIKPFSHKERLDYLECICNFPTESQQYKIHFLNELALSKIYQYSFWEMIEQETEPVEIEQNQQDIKSFYRQIFMARVKISKHTSQLYFMIYQLLFLQKLKEKQYMQQFIKKFPLNINFQSNKLLIIIKFVSFYKKNQHQRAKSFLLAQFQYLPVENVQILSLCLFKIYHKLGNLKKSKILLKINDRFLGENIIKEQFFKQQRILYNYTNIQQYFQSQFVPSKITSTNNMLNFLENFIRSSKYQVKISQSIEQTNKHMKVLIKMLILSDKLITTEFNLHQTFKFKENMENENQLITQFQQLISQKKIQKKQELNIFNEAFNLKLFLCTQIKNEKISRLIVEQLVKNEKISIQKLQFQSIDLIMRIIKQINLPQFHQTQIKIYDQLLPHPQLLQSKIGSFTFMLVFKHVFVQHNWCKFNQLLLLLIDYVDIDPFNQRVNHYIGCLRYVFSDQFKKPLLALLDNGIKSLNFQKIEWKYCFISLFWFQAINKLAGVFSQSQLISQIWKGITYLPFLKNNCVKYIQSIYFPLLLKMPLRLRYQKYLWRIARKNVDCLPTIKKQCYKVKLIHGQIDRISQKKEWSNQFYFKQSEMFPNLVENDKNYSLLSFYMNQNTNILKTIHKGQSKKIGQFKCKNRQIQKYFIKKLLKYHQNCQNENLSNIRKNKNFLLRLQIEELNSRNTKKQY